MNRKRGPLFITDVEGHGQRRDPDIIDYNDPDPSQPGLWCQWAPADDGTFLEWDGGEKFYNSAEWMKFIIENLLSEKAKPYLEKHGNEDPRLHYFTANHVLNGEISAEGEDSDDRWTLVVKDNVTMVATAELTYGDPKPI